MANLEQRVQRLEDIDAIKTLKNSYHLYINDCQFDRLGALFTENATVNMGYMSDGSGVWRGRALIGSKLAEIPQHLSQIKQFLHNHSVEVDGDDASGWAFLEARYGVEADSFNVAAKYEDTYKRVDGAWLFDTMNVKFYYTAPMLAGWAMRRRHQLARVADIATLESPLIPNPPI